MNDLWKAAIDMQVKAVAAQQRMLESGVTVCDPAEALAEAQEATIRAAEANRKAWARWAEVWGIQ